MPLQYSSVTGNLLYIAELEGNPLMNECCCGCSYSIQVVLDWANTADLDLYVKYDSFVCYYGDVISGNLQLNRDAHPTCNPTPAAPEIISSLVNFDESHTFYVWYAQFSSCESETTPTVQNIQILNDGDRDITVSGDFTTTEVIVAPGFGVDISPFAYAGYAVGDESGYANGTEIIVTC